MTTNRTSKPYPAELRERAVRLVREHEASDLQRRVFQRAFDGLQTPGPMAFR